MLTIKQAQWRSGTNANPVRPGTQDQLRRSNLWLGWVDDTVAGARALGEWRGHGTKALSFY